MVSSSIRQWGKQIEMEEWAGSSAWPWSEPIQYVRGNGMAREMWKEKRKEHDNYTKERTALLLVDPYNDFVRGGNSAASEGVAGNRVRTSADLRRNPKAAPSLSYHIIVGNGD